MAASIRPERVALAAAIESRSGWNVFDATVEMVVFQGANVQYRLRLPNGRELVAERPNDAAIAVAAGDRLQAGWAAESAVMLES